MILFDDEKKCGPGRPATEAPWYEAAAKLVAYGLPLRRALWEVGVRVNSERELKNIYRHVRFKAYHEAYRRQFLLEWGRVSPRFAASVLNKFSF